MAALDLCSTSHANSVVDTWTTSSICGLTSASWLLFAKLSKSLTSLANVYSSSTTPAAVPGSFENCQVARAKTDETAEEQSIPAVKLFPVRVRDRDSAVP